MNPAALAKVAIARALAGEAPESLSWETPLDGLFLILRDAEGEVRASFGTSRAEAPSSELLARLAREAASADPRYPPLASRELAGLSLTLWVLTEPRPLESPAALRPDHAIRVERAPFAGVFLPENYVGPTWEPIAHLKQACRRAGLQAKAFQEAGVSIVVFSTQRYDA